MANVNIDALYAGSLKITVARVFFFFLNNFTFYEWGVTKVAHCNVFSTPRDLTQSLIQSKVYSIINFVNETNRVSLKNHKNTHTKNSMNRCMT